MSSQNIVPVHSFDDNDLTRGSLLYLTFGFDAVLDASAVKGSLETLMSIGNWKKLGARVRQKQNGGLEYHLPPKFSQECPGFIFTQDKVATSIKQHPLASKFPHCTDGQPSVQADPQELLGLARRPNGPKKLADFLQSDEPQISLHVVSFDDATLVTISWLHILCDITAISEVLKSMILILQGREAEVPDVFPLAEDPFETLSVNPPEPCVNEKRQLAGLSLVVFFVRFFANLLWYRNARRLVYLPPNYVHALKTKANVELKETSFSLSEGDIITTLLTRLALRNTSPNSNQTITIWNVLDVRGPLASTVLAPASSVYLGNAVLGVIAFVSAHQLITKPLSVAASIIRHAVEEQRTPAQIHALAALSEKTKKEKRPCLFGDATGRLFFYSNWKRADFFQLDFSAATPSSDGQPVRPSMIIFNSEAQHPVKTNTILGQDAAGGYWIDLNMEDGNWNGVQQMLEEFQTDSHKA